MLIFEKLRSRANRILAVSVISFFFIIVLMWQLVFFVPDAGLSVVFFKNGSIYINSPNNTHVLIDGGNDKSILSDLAEVLPWYERTLDVVVATVMNSRHIAGLVNVLERYSVTRIYEASAGNSSSVRDAFESAVYDELRDGALSNVAKDDIVLNIGNGVALEFLSPHIPKNGGNAQDGAVVLRLIYGTSSSLFLSDISDGAWSEIKHQYTGEYDIVYHYDGQFYYDGITSEFCVSGGECKDVLDESRGVASASSASAKKRVATANLYADSQKKACKTIINLCDTKSARFISLKNKLEPI